MTTAERIQGRRIGIVGMARSGVAAALLARRLGGEPFVSDVGPAKLLNRQTRDLTEAGIPFETDGHSDRLLASDYIVISPGVPLQSDIVTRIREKGLPIFAEIELASWVCQGRIVAVTGSNGKTTTTTLIGEMLQAGGYETVVCGNIGRPFADVAARIPPAGMAVVEVSNFQLETIADFRPYVAVILNLTEDHLDRHGSFDNYKQAKYRITENQEVSDYLILNQDDRVIMADNIATSARRRYFTAQDNPEATSFVRGRSLWVRRGDDTEEVLPCQDILIPGPHNLQNAAAAAAVASVLGVPAAVLREVLTTFAGVEHRLETVSTVAGIKFINDSKATNVDSVCFALQSVESPIYLIAGGRDKGGSFDRLVPYGRGKLKGIVAIGEAREKIRTALGGEFPVHFAGTMQEAVQVSFELAHPGETVLLSPACASFDMFHDFEQRGLVFKEAVTALRNGKTNSETLPT